MSLTEGEERVKQKDLGDGVYGFEYYPMIPGTYTVTITWGGQNIGQVRPWMSALEVARLLPCRA